MNPNNISSEKMSLDFYLIRTHQRINELSEKLRQIRKIYRYQSRTNLLKAKIDFIEKTISTNEKLLALLNTDGNLPRLIQ